MHIKSNRFVRLSGCLSISVLATISTFSAAVDAQLKVLPIGDSITRGINGLAGEGRISYRQEFESRLDASGCSQTMLGSQSNSTPGHTSSHEGYSGHRVDHFQLGLGSNPGITTIMADNSDAEVVLLHLGTNDMLQSQPVADTIVELAAVIAEINPSATRNLYLANVVPLYDVDSNGDGILDVPNASVESLSAQITATFANDPFVHLVDVRTGFRSTDMFPDGIHPSQDDDGDPRSDSGEHHIAVAFAAALEAEGDCTPSGTDSSFPLTHILTPAVDDSISGSLTITGKAVDTGSTTAIGRVRLAIQDNSGDWWDFDSGLISSSFDSIDANITQSSNNYADWRAGFTDDYPQESGIEINLPSGEYTLFALAIDAEGNQNYFNTGLWPERTQFYVSNSAATCNGKAVTVFMANGDTPTSGADVILGTAGADTIVAMGGDDTICGLGGDDDINGGRGQDWIDAGAGDDTVQGANDADEIFGDTGVDTLFGGPGDDTIYGEDGDDFIKGNSGNDTLEGGDGVDYISGGSGNDTIETGAGSNVGTSQTVTGGDGDDTIYGGADADELRGEAGNDEIYGGTGDDRLFGGGGEDTVSGQGGDDLVRGNGAADLLYGGSGDDQIDGLGGNDVMYGGSGIDTMTGSTGNDTMYGQTGNDVLNGGGGNDVLDGGADTDDCNGAGGTGDTATSCETEANIP